MESVIFTITTVWVLFLLMQLQIVPFRPNFPLAKAREMMNTACYEKQQKENTCRWKLYDEETSKCISHIAYFSILLLLSCGIQESVV